MTEVAASLGSDDTESRLLLRRAQLCVRELCLPLNMIDRHGETLTSTGLRRENDAEHSFLLALAAAALAEHVDSELDTGLVALYAIVHDLAETLTGDNPVYEPIYTAEQKEVVDSLATAELQRRFDVVSDRITSLLAAYLRFEDAESRYVYGMDKIVPYLTILELDRHPLRPDHSSYLATEAKARAKIARRYPKLLPLFDVVAEEVRSRPHFFTTD
ncbi:MAG TPA: HD domain-containing protein [Iamia sp.]|nr:HD domain-containing protein [Iamia sp.]